MTWLEKMDIVLQCLYDHSGDNPTFEMLQNWLKDMPIDKGEIQDITLYLYREQMMYCEYGGDRNHAYIEKSESRYLISCKGKLFLEGIGGFVAQDRQNSKAKTHQSWQTWAIVVGTVLAGLYGLFEIIKALVRFLTSSCSV